VPVECVTYSNKWACDADYFYQGVANNGHLGFALSGWGDFDGGGWDILMGGGAKIEDCCPFPPDVATVCDTLPTRAALSFNPSGCATPPCPLSVQFTFVQPPTSGDPDIHLGWSLAFAGDIDDDGYDDIAIGAPLASFGGKKRSGAIYVIFGSNASIPATVDVEVGLSTHRGVRLRGATANDWLGYSLTDAGDVDGDGYPDLLVGAPQSALAPITPSLDDPGIAYVVKGSFLASTAATGTWPEVTIGSSNAYVVLGEHDHARQGYAVSGMGDVTGDGRADVVIGAIESRFVCTGDVGSFVPTSTTSGGYVEVRKFNPATQTLDLVVRIHGDAPNPITVDDGDWFGMALSGFGGRAGQPGGDVDGDGTPDLIIGAPLWDQAPPTSSSPENQGKAVVISGADIAAGTSNPTPIFSATGAQTWERFGWSVTGGGLATPDDVPDFTVGSRGYSESPVACDATQRGGLIGAVRLYCGGLFTMILLIRGEQDRSVQGFAVAWLGDRTGNGRSELVVAAPAWAVPGCTGCNDPSGCCELGRVYVHEF
jgi:hypothetical protein